MVLAPAHSWPGHAPSFFVCGSSCPKSLRTRSGRRSPSVVLAASKRQGLDGFGARPSQDEARRRLLLDYVREVDTASVHKFIAGTRPEVVSAMKQTVHNIVGTLPASYFEVRISAVAESLATLLMTVMTTGYMLRGAQSRLELANALQSLPAGPPVTSGTQARDITALLPFAAASGGNRHETYAADGTFHGLPQSGSLGGSRVHGGGGSGDVVLVAEAVAAVMAGGGGGGASGEGCGEGGLAVAELNLPLACTAFVPASVEEHYAPGVQKSKVEGDVMRWHHEKGLVKMPATQYMERLEHEVAALRQQLLQQQQRSSSSHLGSLHSTGSYSSSHSGGCSTGHSGSSTATLHLAGGAVADTGGWSVKGMGGGSNGNSGSGGANGMDLLMSSVMTGPSSRLELLEYLKTLQDHSLKELTAGASSEDVQEAMRLFVGRLMGTADLSRLRSMTSEFTSPELSKLLFFLLVVGYTLKALEVRCELDGSMDV